MLATSPKISSIVLEQSKAAETRKFRQKTRQWHKSDMGVVSIPKQVMLGVLKTNRFFGSHHCTMPSHQGNSRQSRNGAERKCKHAYLLFPSLL